MKKYTTLLPGDIRQLGDIFVRNGRTEKDDYGYNTVCGLQYPVQLIGHPILLSDLIADTFYRPNV